MAGADAVVSTPSGLLRGAVDHRRPSVRRHLGIPYALAPVGPLRFKPPVAATPWTGEREATSFGSRAMQRASMLAPAGEPQSEDCLVLNVWSPVDAQPGRGRPVDANPGRGRPVLVWFHGGGFTSGSGALSWYDGAALAERGVVVVTVNYRLGPLGFLHLESIGGEAWSGAANLGLLDQAMALEWVAGHIGSFGGDPSRVTIFGESAGGMSVATHLAFGPSRGRFHAAIAQSGAATHVQDSERAERTARAVVELVGVTPGRLGGMADVPAEALLDAAASVESDMRDVGLPLPFQPTVDGVTLVDPPLQALASGVARDIPLVIGTTAEEMRLFMLMARLGGGGSALDDRRLMRRLDRLAEAQGAAVPAPEIRDRYVECLGTSDPTEVWQAVLTDVVFGVPAVRTARAHAAAGGSAWTYLFERPSAAFEGALGAAHATEIPYVFDNLDRRGTEFLLGPVDDTGRALATVMAADWVEVADAHAAPWSRRAADDAPGHGTTRVYGAGPRRDSAVDTAHPHRDRHAVWTR